MSDQRSANNPNGSCADKKSCKKWIALGAAVVLAVVGFVAYQLYYVGNHAGYAPTQPIPFSHKIHAGQYQIPCMYCHAGVEKSKHATIPAMNLCMNCHSVVKPDSPHIQKLKQLVNEKKEVFQWVKVHDLPDFVQFNHKRHVAKGIACETCHGDVKQMAKITQVSPLTMGWCLDCHRGTSAPAHIERKKADEPTDPKINPQGPGRFGIETGHVASQSCYTCHH